MVGDIRMGPARGHSILNGNCNDFITFNPRKPLFCENIFIKFANDFPNEMISFQLLSSIHSDASTISSLMGFSDLSSSPGQIELLTS